MKKTAVHKHIYDSYCRVNKGTGCHQESKFGGNFINLQKKKKKSEIKKTQKANVKFGNILDLQSLMQFKATS